MGSDSSGNIYVSDVSSNFVGVYSSTFGSIRTLGVPGANSSAAGQFAGPEGIAVVGSTVFVVDFGNSRVESFSQSSGGYLAQFAVTGNPTGMVYNPLDGLLYVVENNAGTPAFRIEKFTIAGVSFGSFALPLSGYGLAIDSAGYLYVSQTTSISKYQTDGAFIRSIGSFSHVLGVAVDRAGFVYGVDNTGSLPIIKFDSQGNVAASYAASGAQGSNGFVNSPQGIVVSNVQNIVINIANHVYVVDDNNSRVAVYDSAGNYPSSFGSSGTGNGQFQAMAEITIDRFDYIYVADPVLERVQEFTPGGAFYAGWGSAGTGGGNFSTATGVAVDSNRALVYTVDYIGAHLQAYNWYGTFVKDYPAATSGPGQLIHPYGVSVDTRGNIYVADRGRNQIVQFDAAGNYVTAFGVSGSGAGQFGIANEVFINSTTGQMYVTDLSNNNVQRWGAMNPKNDTIGIYRASTRNFYLRDSNTTGYADFTTPMSYAAAGDLALAGDWNADGAGVFRPTNGLIYLRSTLSTGFADFTMTLGLPGDRGVAGDWNGDGQDSPGIFRPSNLTFYLTNKVANGVVYGDYSLLLGLGSDLPIGGDWVHQGSSGVGVFRPSNGIVYLKNNLMPGFADTNITFGIANDQPVAGHWQFTYPPVPPGGPAASILIAKTPVPSGNSNNNSVEGGSQIGG